MAFDMSQFHQVFFDETDEHLASMEALLLGMDLSAPSADELNAIFRAAHSIKGGAATFGFEDLAGLTHIAEGLLDPIRKGEVSLTAPLVDALLEAKDVLLALLDAHRGGAPVPDADVERVATRLRTASVQPLPSQPDPVSSSPVLTHFSTPEAARQTGPFRIEIAVSAGQEVEDVLEGLRSFGVVAVLRRADPATGQPWLAEIETELTLDDIAETLAFTLSPAHFMVTPLPAPAEDEDFGLFEPVLPAREEGALQTDEVVLVEEEGFGLFAPLPPAGMVSANPEDGVLLEEDGFGLFEPLPSEGPAVAQPEGEGEWPVASASANGEVAYEEPGFGLFRPLPKHEAPEGEPAPPSAPAPQASPPAESARPATTTRNERAAASAAESSIRVSTDKVDLLLNLVGELVITQSMLQQSGSQLDPASHERLLHGISLLERNSRELQEAVMSIRMTPVSFVFSRFPRVVRDLASKLGKQVELKMVGENTELDKGFIEKLADPLTHLVRNSLDHGLEVPDARVAKGKSPVGRLTLRAFHQGGSIVIEVTDDGAGLSRERILSKARERGMAVSDALSDTEVWGLIFEPGFSTASTVTDVSGRGVGMDVVRRNIHAMGGQVSIDSLPDFGTTIAIQLPLTLAILDGMSVRIGEEIYILPLSFVVESLQPTAGQVHRVAGRGRVVNVRGEYLPIVALGELFLVPGAGQHPERGILIIVEADDCRMALLVDDLIGQQQFVVKNLETHYRKVEGVSGATILGNGQVALILDVTTIVRSQRQVSPLAGSEVMVGAA
ncbi:Chemotaxis protein histidine kinase CheA [Gulbenkiania indica]|uniref:Chemotaxis protein CheA n=1 Tax=Gulbenkiania indica TaxID=375574 RepID=A0A0K6GRV2_9NEIS|nr:chemotaxis protein CheW [Gulbenkiania indica]CUA81450.1 Chemotaxis protein histidine kinase CheA [Gulbenkiania indica]